MPTNTNWNTVNYWQTFNSTRTINLTFASNGNQQGLVLFIRGFYTGTFTVVLKEGTTTRTTDTFNLTSTPITPATHTNLHVSAHYFPLTSYAVTTAAATWKYEITASSATPQALTTTSGGTDFCYAVNLDADTSAISSSDTTILADGVTLSIDGTTTHASTNGRSVIQCLASTYRCLNADLSGATTITFSGDVFVSYNSKFLIGTDGTTPDPISVANRLTIDYSGNSLAYLFNTPVSSSFGGTLTSSAFEFYGAESSYIGTRIATTANASQAHIITTTDMSSQWSNGDALCIIGKVRPGAVDTTNYTISNISGTDITLNTNLDYPVLAGGAVTNLNEKDNCGIQITALSTQALFPSSTIIGHNHVAGIYLFKAGVGTSIILRRINKNLLVRNILFDDQNATPSFSTFYYSGATNGVISNIYHFSTRSTYISMIFALFSGNNITISNIYTKNTYYGASSSGQVAVLGNNNTVSGLVHSGGRYNSTYTGYYFSGASNTFTDIFDYGLSGFCCTSLLVNSTIDGIVLNGAFTSHLNFSNSIGLVVKNGQIGNTTRALTSEFTTVADTINQVILVSPTFNASPVAIATGLDVSLPGSYIRVKDYNGTANDNRGYESYGNYVSSGTGLVDTTTHNSVGFALRREPTSSVDRDTWTFKIPTGNIQNKSATFIIWCKINSATYYAGTYEAPRIDINYDNGTHRYAWAATTGTDWQRLTVSFTPTTTYGEVEITMSTMTDATGSDAYVYWSEYDFQLPSGVQINPGIMTYWANGLPITGLATNVTEKGVADAVWDDLTADHSVANSFATKLKSLKYPSLLIDVK